MRQYLVQYFYKPSHRERYKKYKNIKEACIEEDKILTQKKDKLKGILIESNKTWRLLINF